MNLSSSTQTFLRSAVPIGDPIMMAAYENFLRIRGLCHQFKGIDLDVGWSTFWSYQDKIKLRQTMKKYQHTSVIILMNTLPCSDRAWKITKNLEELVDVLIKAKVSETSILLDVPAKEQGWSFHLDIVNYTVLDMLATRLEASLRHILVPYLKGVGTTRGATLHDRQGYGYYLINTDTKMTTRNFVGYLKMTTRNFVGYLTSEAAEFHIEQVFLQK